VIGQIAISDDAESNVSKRLAAMKPHRTGDPQLETKLFAG
jgi:hypothetical protein